MDDTDFDKVNSVIWYLEKNGYVSRRSYKNGVKKTLKLHRVIMDCPDGMEVDHINHDRLDNRKENLRICTLKQNRGSRLKKKNSVSKFKGVSKNGNNWRAYISLDGKLTDLGTYKNERIAALMYDFWAIDHYKQFAETNFKIISYK